MYATKKLAPVALAVYLSLPVLSFLSLLILEYPLGPPTKKNHVLFFSLTIQLYFIAVTSASAIDTRYELEKRVTCADGTGAFS